MNNLSLKASIGEKPMELNSINDVHPNELNVWICIISPRILFYVIMLAQPNSENYFTKKCKKSIFSLDQRVWSWYEFWHINWFIMMNSIIERRQKGDDHGSQNQR
jgi:hypothetical protein